jgi:hypothetical protein
MDKVYKCDLCNKNYKSYQTLWKHNKNIHGQKCHKIGQFRTKKDNLHDKNVHNKLDENNRENTCEYCNKTLSCMRSLKRHYNICKMKKNIIIENEKLKADMSILKTETEKQIDELRKQINELLNKNCKMHYKTLQKINNSGNMNTGTINNTINIMALGHENIDDVLTKTDKIAILNKKENALPYMIEMVHFNDKYPQFKNIAITNNRTKQAYVYDTDSKVFKLIDKDELIEELIEYRVCDIEDYYINYKNELELPVKRKIEELIERRGEDDITKDKIKLLLFNNRHKIKV